MSQTWWLSRAVRVLGFWKVWQRDTAHPSRDEAVGDLVARVDAAATRPVYYGDVVPVRIPPGVAGALSYPAGAPGPVDAAAAPGPGGRP